MNPIPFVANRLIGKYAFLPLITCVFYHRQIQFVGMLFLVSNHHSSYKQMGSQNIK